MTDQPMHLQSCLDSLGVTLSLVRQVTMQNRFKVSARSVQFGRAEYVIECTLTNKRSKYAIGGWREACQMCTEMNGAVQETQEKEVNEYFA